MQNGEQPKKKHIGRPKGANSFVPITLEELRHYAGDKTRIPVSRVWLEGSGANFEEIEAITKEVEQAEQPKVEFTVTKGGV